MHWQSFDTICLSPAHDLLSKKCTLLKISESVSKCVQIDFQKNSSHYILCIYLILTKRFSIFQVDWCCQIGRGGGVELSEGRLPCPSQSVGQWRARTCVTSPTLLSTSTSLYCSACSPPLFGNGKSDQSVTCSNTDLRGLLRCLDPPDVPCH